ncbi:unnamed protein product [Cuscuta epithymum]|uniref:Uncharacterized protein n=1 Tax=Cuscuta epithymum TaxID=186058 RepID=A0AAV0GM34_9ASTE|nr:unnamed protein product [Cuscuta epithymum]
MASIFCPFSLPTRNPSFLIPNRKCEVSRLRCSQPRFSSSGRKAVSSEGTEGGVTEKEPPDCPGPTSAQAQLDLLEKLTSSSPDVNGNESDGGSSNQSSIRDQLTKLVGDRDDDFTIPLGKNLKSFTPKFLTISQKRNMRRQAYLDEVSRRNDSAFFAKIGSFIILPPFIILGIALANGYVHLLP